MGSLAPPASGTIGVHIQVPLRNHHDVRGLRNQDAPTAVIRRSTPQNFTHASSLTQLGCLAILVEVAADNPLRL